jgi:hypothetical protein
VAANAQVLVKAAEASEMVWRKADFIREGHWRGTGISIMRAMGISKDLVDAPTGSRYNIIIGITLRMIEGGGICTDEVTGPGDTLYRNDWEKVYPNFALN